MADSQLENDPPPEYVHSFLGIVHSYFQVCPLSLLSRIELIMHLCNDTHLASNLKNLQRIARHVPPNCNLILTPYSVYLIVALSHALGIGQPISGIGCRSIVQIERF